MATSSSQPADLQAERIADPTPYTDFLYTPQDKAAKDLAVDLLKNDPVIRPSPSMFEMHRHELVNWGFEIIGRVFDLIRAGKCTNEEIGRAY
jgi:hypothetical protein